MKPVFQTTFGSPGGNCFQACVASILEMPIDALPAFGQDVRFLDKGQWYIPRMSEWLIAHCGVGMLLITNEKGGAHEFIQSAIVIAGGDTTRGTLGGHCVVWQDGRCIHDPYPGGEGLSRPPEEFYLFFLPDPSKGRK